MRDRLKVAIIGYGRMGEIHAEVWASIPEARLVGIADADVKRRYIANARITQHECGVYEAPEQVLSAEKPELAVVATPAPAHAAHAIEAILAGCHVICEKPMALDLEEADRMVSTARRHGRVLAVHHQTVFTNAVQRALAMIAAGEIGDLYYVEGWCKGRPAPYDLMEVGGHVLHLMRYFAGGEASEVFGDAAHMGRLLNRGDVRPLETLYPAGRPMGIGGGDYLFGYYRFARGVRGILRLKTLPGESNEYMAVELHGTKGRLRIHQTSTGRLFRKPTPHDDFATLHWQEVDPAEIWDPDPRWIAPMRRFAEDVIAAIREERPPKVSGDDGRAVLEMALGIYASHFAGEPLLLPLKERTHPLLG